MISYEDFDPETVESITSILEESEEFEDFDGYIEFIEKGRVIIDGHLDAEQMQILIKILKMIQESE